MLPMKTLRFKLGTLLAADATTLAPAMDANVIALVKADFTLSENLVAGDLTLADFTGSTPLAGSTGAQLTGIDPSTGDQIVTIKAPLGGWRWACTGAPGSPQNIYGFVLLSNDLATVIGAEKLPVVQQITVIGDIIDLGAVEITFVQQPMS